MHWILNYSARVLPNELPITYRIFNPPLSYNLSKWRAKAEYRERLISSVVNLDTSMYLVHTSAACRERACQSAFLLFLPCLSQNIIPVRDYVEQPRESNAILHRESVLGESANIASALRLILIRHYIAWTIAQAITSRIAKAVATIGPGCASGASTIFARIGWIFT